MGNSSTEGRLSWCLHTSYTGAGLPLGQLPWLPDSGPEVFHWCRSTGRSREADSASSRTTVTGRCSSADRSTEAGAASSGSSPACVCVGARAFWGGRRRRRRSGVRARPPGAGRQQGRLGRGLAGQAGGGSPAAAGQRPAAHLEGVAQAQQRAVALQPHQRHELHVGRQRRAHAAVRPGRRRGHGGAQRGAGQRGGGQHWRVVQQLLQRAAAARGAGGGAQEHQVHAARDEAGAVAVAAAAHRLVQRLAHAALVVLQGAGEAGAGAAARVGRLQRRERGARAPRQRSGARAPLTLTVRLCSMTSSCPSASEAAPCARSVASCSDSRPSAMEAPEVMG
jgi:hypothetical protein